MKQVAVVSGKGGTGKTTVTASLAHLAGEVVSVDCDVDAANLALLLPGEDGPVHEFVSGQRARVNPELCIGCGVCTQVCRFDANALGEDGVTRVDPLACEGCVACQLVCPVEAIRMHGNHAGVWSVRATGVGPLVHAELGVAQSNSGKLVAQVRQQAREIAEQRGLELVLIDGPPGVGCPVHAAVTGVDLLVAVTEPTPAGAHDLERLLELAAGFELRVAVVVNKADLEQQLSTEIEQMARRRGAELLGRLPFRTAVPALLARSRPELPPAPVADELAQVWRELQRLL